ncbi:MAG: (Fe-S)-binding protein, partial [Planctomycetota bacterium]
SLRAMLQLLPRDIPTRVRLPTLSRATTQLRGSVALLVGCAQSVLQPDINSATIDVLNRNGFDVHLPRGQVCCGALSWHLGQQKQAQGFAIRNLEAFSSIGKVDAILTNAAGCGSGMHEYPLILKGTEFEQKATEFVKGVKDVAQFLADVGLVEPLPDKAASSTVAYHDACHLANAQKVRDAPRALLGQIPGLELKELPDSHLCCGSAGTYNLDQPEIASSLGRQKAKRVIESGASQVATGNIGCLTQLQHHLQEQDSNVRVRHTMQVLRDAYSTTRSE